jgi:hypothetical protein
VAELLLGFGMILPPADYCAFDDADGQKKLFKQIKSIAPAELDAYLLARFCGIRFAWTASLSCHLELDKSAKVLYVFRYPSFCLAHISHPLTTEEESHRTPIHSCVFEASQYGVKWASPKDVSELLEEILLSYRLLFGQSKRSRRLFHKNLRPFAGIPPEGQDELLFDLCGLKKLPKRSSVRGENSEYDLSEDFPHLRSRLVKLVGFMAEKKPRNLRDMWLDKRDSASWMTFWAVLIFGSLGLFLSFIQTVFQVLQYVAALEGG